ncbi:MAG: MBL fold metallo-hydrolase [Haliscomenobacter sp.]|nr:MBL fold metallo-hydrolase [Haliscomenobacter sp.]
MVTLTGTGTSQGVPVLGCDCEVCQSTDLRDKRLRTAALLSWGDTTVAFDCGPDFRQQMLAAGTQHLDAILMTHEHNDHVVGLDDVRPFNFKQGGEMPVFATEKVQKELKTRFAYVFAEGDKRYPGAPMVSLITIDKNTVFSIKGLSFLPVELMHGKLPILGFRVGDFAYLTDVHHIEATEIHKLQNLHTLVINALHHTEHYSHLNLNEALDLIHQLKPQHSYLTHMSHRMGKHAEINKTLPAGVELGYDGLQIRIPLP